MANITVPAAARSTNALFFPVNGLTIPSNANSATIAFDMPIQAERTDLTQHMDYGIQIQMVGSTVWKSFANAGWDGSTSVAKFSTVVSPAPVMTLGGDFFGAFAGNLARVAVKLRNPMTLGGTISSTRR